MLSNPQDNFKKWSVTQHSVSWLLMAGPDERLYLIWRPLHLCKGWELPPSVTIGASVFLLSFDCSFLWPHNVRHWTRYWDLPNLLLQCTRDRRVFHRHSLTARSLVLGHFCFFLTHASMLGWRAFLDQLLSYAWLWTEIPVYGLYFLKTIILLSAS